MKQNLSMQHERGLQIVRDEAQRKIDDAINQARLSEEKAIAQSRKIEYLQSQMHQLSQLIRIDGLWNFKVGIYMWSIYLTIRTKQLIV